MKCYFREFCGKGFFSQQPRLIAPIEVKLHAQELGLGAQEFFEELAVGYSERLQRRWDNIATCHFAPCD